MDKKCFLLKSEENEISVSNSSFCGADVYLFPTDDEKFICYAFAADGFLEDSKGLSVAEYVKESLMVIFANA